MEIVTFSCQRNKIFVYEDGCEYKPRFPFKPYSSLENALEDNPDAVVITRKTNKK